MAIKVTKNGEKMNVEIDNGHAKALEKIVSDYNIKGEEEALGFILAVFSQGNGKKIEINGAAYEPADSIRKTTPPANGQTE